MSADTVPDVGLSGDERVQIVAASLVDQTVGKNWHRTFAAVEVILAARLAALEARATAAETKVAAVLDEVERRLREHGHRGGALTIVREVRAALASEDAARGMS